MSLSLQVGACTSTLKPQNQDSHAYKVVQLAGGTPAGMFAVADGVGGLAHGDIASNMAIGLLNHWWEREIARYTSMQQLEASLRDHLAYMNQTMLNYADEQDLQFGTTIVLAVVVGEQALVANIGDSRCYLSLHGVLRTKLVQASCDHCTLVKQTRANGTVVLKPKLTYCLGTKPELRIHVRHSALKAGDALLVCSDGVCKKLEDKYLARVLAQRELNPKDLCGQLVAQARTQGEQDDITAVLVRLMQQEEQSIAGH